MSEDCRKGIIIKMGNIKPSEEAVIKLIEDSLLFDLEWYIKTFLIQ